MKCPACGTDSKKQEREANGNVCTRCKRRFRLDATDALTDWPMERCIAKLSDDGKRKFAKEQLVAEVERFLVRKKRTNARTVTVILSIVFGLLACIALVGATESWVPVPIVVAIAALLAFAIWTNPPLEAREAGGAVDRYLAFGAPPNMVAPKPRGPARKAAREYDLESYGFDRVVVVQHAWAVEVLVQNHFHFEHNAAIVSMDGHPEHVAAHVAKQLASGDTHAKVYLLHDASAEAFEAAEAFLKTSPIGRAQVVRLGLFPKTVEKLVPRHVGREPPTTAGLASSDLQWLAKGSLELAALRPVQLMTLLFNGFARGDAIAPIAADVGFVEPVDVAYDFG